MWHGRFQGFRKSEYKASCNGRRRCPPVVFGIRFLVSVFTVLLLFTNLLIYLNTNSHKRVPSTTGKPRIKFLEEKNSAAYGRTNAPFINKKLIDIFNSSDADSDGELDERELASHIHNGILNHFSNAVKDNFEHYFEMDRDPKNGLVSHSEFFGFFLNNKSISAIKPEDIGNRTAAFQSLPKDIKVEIASLEARWSEVASNSPDFLTVDEFLAFWHPEVSPTKILASVQDTFLTFDLDGNGIISNDEFDTVYREAEDVDPVYKKDKQVIDADGNGEISRAELMRYMDPRGMHHSVKEATELISYADKDKDGRLSLMEILSSSDKIVNSKFYDVDKALHKDLW